MNTIFNWIKEMFQEKSFRNAIIVAAVALISLIGGLGLIETATIAAIVWAVMHFWWKEKS